MCWAFRVADVAVRATAAEIVEPHLGRIVGSGREMPILVRRGTSYTWMSSRYGMILPGERGRRNLVWNARDDRLEAVETWARYVRQRFAVPIDAYSENDGVEMWRSGGPAFLVGFYDADLADGGGAVAVTTQDGDRRPPVLISRADAARWLEAPQWEVVPMLKRMARVPFGEADVFESKRLSADARTRVPLRKAA